MGGRYGRAPNWQIKANSAFGTAAHGGAGWQPRVDAHADEFRTVWADCGIENEWHPLLAVLLHTPGAELEASRHQPDKVRMLQALDIGKAQDEHAQ